MKWIKLQRIKFDNLILPQTAFSCSKSTMETLKQYIKSVYS